MGRQAANTKIGPKRVHEVRVRGGNRKFRALRLDSGNFSWGSEGISRKCRVIQVVYHPSNNELVRTNSLTKSAIIQIDAAPLRQWYEAHYGQSIGKGKSGRKTEGGETEKSATTTATKSKHVERKIASRASSAKVESALDTQFAAGRLYAAVSSRPGQSGRCDGYVLEGEELSFILRALNRGK